MIMSYGDPDVQAFFEGERIRRWINIERSLMRKLAVLNDARKLEDLRDPPSNRLKALRGDRNGQFSIRVNDQFRICFVWINGHAHGVTVVDYH
jgi:proteic killer suppression protein